MKLNALLPSQHAPSALRWSLLALGAFLFTIGELGLCRPAELAPLSEHRSNSVYEQAASIENALSRDWSAVAF